ncbi:uncharacterized protein DS421_3g98820 [Arachis hypogaea]|nr:uncharacterized protein DS421_3g98820 [Arachis hypogaea]
MQASDRFNINSQLEHLQAKYVGTGHADLNRFEWAVNIQRDSYASYIGHYPLLAYFAIAENESIGRERYTFMQSDMSRPDRFFHGSISPAPDKRHFSHSRFFHLCCTWSWPLFNNRKCFYPVVSLRKEKKIENFRLGDLEVTESSSSFL